MKLVVKQAVMAAALLIVTAPAFAGEAHMPTKGTKSYQTAHTQVPEQTDITADAADTAKPEDVQNISPAAGATDEPAENGKSFKEEMRLPRKN